MVFLLTNMDDVCGSCNERLQIEVTKTGENIYSTFSQISCLPQGLLCSYNNCVIMWSHYCVFGTQMCVNVFIITFLIAKQHNYHLELISFSFISHC
jgi:hypothetical protein